MWLGAIAITVTLALGIVGKISETHVRVFDKTYEIDLYGKWTAVADQKADTAP